MSPEHCLVVSGHEQSRVCLVEGMMGAVEMFDQNCGRDSGEKLIRSSLLFPFSPGFGVVQGGQFWEGPEASATSCGFCHSCFRGNPCRSCGLEGGWWKEGPPRQEASLPIGKQGPATWDDLSGTKQSWYENRDWAPAVQIWVVSPFLVIQPTCIENLFWVQLATLNWNVR